MIRSYLSITLLCASCLSIEVVAEDIATAPYYPLASGASWLYRGQEAGQTYEFRREVDPGTTTLHGTATYTVRESSGGEANLHYFSTNSGVRLHAEVYGSWMRVEMQTPHILVPATISVGAKYSYATPVTVSSIEGTSAGMARSSADIQGRESVTVPAGTFQTIKIKIDESWEIDGEVVEQTQTTMWLAEGVGMVKSIESGFDYTDIFELRSYTIPGASSGDKPAIVQQPQSISVRAGDNATFSVTVTGTAPFSYQWQFNDGNLAGQTQAALELGGVTSSQAGAYRVIVSNASGSVTSQAAQLVVTNAPSGNTNQAAPRILRARGGTGSIFEIIYQGLAGQTYRIDSTTDLKQWTERGQVTAADGTNAWRDTDLSSPLRFYRLATIAGGTPVTPPTVATLPQPGVIYQAGTRLGGSIFGVELTIPNEWKGGLHPNSSLMMFASDIHPGIILGALGFAGNREAFLNDPNLRNGFEMTTGNEKAWFKATRPVTAVGENRISAEFEGSNSEGSYVLIAEFVLHPSGGYMGFLGMTTVQQKDIQRPHVVAFAQSVVTTPRDTHLEYMAQLSGRTYKWSAGGNDWYHNTPFGSYVQSASSSSWSQSYASFCSLGTFELSTTSETYASTTSPSHGFMQISGSSTSQEYGDWTIVRVSPTDTVLLMVTLKGFQLMPMRVDPDGSILVGPNRLVAQSVFNCDR